MCIKEKRDKFEINGKYYTVIRVLGESKSGYLYQVMHGRNIYMLKDFKSVKGNDSVNFEELIKSVIADYETLCSLGIPVPKLIDYDLNTGILVREYVGGLPISEMLLHGSIKGVYLDRIKTMAEAAEDNGLALDYFPTCYIAKKDLLYYLCYYTEELTDCNSFDIKGIRYWMNAADFTVELSKGEVRRTL